MSSPATSWPAVLLLAALVAACGDESGPAESPARDGAAAIPAWAHVAPEQIAEAAKHGVPVAFENDLGMRFVLIPAGTFRLGSPEDEEGRGDDETQHDVTISKPFYMQITEVTNRQFRGFDPLFRSISYHFFDIDEDERPAWVTHAEARHLALWLTARDGVRSYRLPYVKEWQYACRANQGTTWWFGDDWAKANRYENLYFGDDGFRSTAPVASFPPSPWGLYDMLGNVAEWCADVYAHDEPTPWGRLPIEVARCGGSFDVGRKDLYDREELWVRGGPVSREPVGVRLVSPLSEPGE